MKTIVVINWQRWKYMIQKGRVPPPLERIGKSENVFKFTLKLEEYLNMNEIDYSIVFPNEKNK
jgi:hypothetical protein